MKRRIRVAILCYSLMPATIDLLNRLSDWLADVDLRVFPLVDHDIRGCDVRFAYRPNSFKGRYVTLRGEIPEGQLLTSQIPLIFEMVTRSNLIILLGIQSVPAVLAAILAKDLK